MVQGAYNLLKLRVGLAPVYGPIDGTTQAGGEVGAVEHRELVGAQPKRLAEGQNGEPQCGGSIGRLQARLNDLGDDGVIRRFATPDVGTLSQRRTCVSLESHLQQRAAQLELARQGHRLERCKEEVMIIVVGVCRVTRLLHSVLMYQMRVTKLAAD